ncbi:helix-turn-helix transcriptional regulator [Paenibacillus sp. EKM212P]|uniref:helix-turn-helix transcriptional regulator n=1 Tax=Paenibacillus sp. EKM212P TaxID=1683680 RepID=UPI001EE9B613|nr:helix-turn-helix transcriptional regulator [Paenibacillus sp. EKM212P]
MVTMKRTLLAELRKSEGSQEDVAKNLDISRQYLSMMELGLRNPTAKLMVKMERHFKIPAEKIFPDLFFEDDCHKMKQKRKTA